MNFTHLDEAGHARMVDVTQKQPTVRSQPTICSITNSLSPFWAETT